MICTCDENKDLLATIDAKIDSKDVGLRCAAFGDDIWLLYFEVRPPEGLPPRDTQVGVGLVEPPFLGTWRVCGVARSAGTTDGTLWGRSLSHFSFVATNERCTTQGEIGGDCLWEMNGSFTDFTQKIATHGEQNLSMRYVAVSTLENDAANV